MKTHWSDQDLTDLDGEVWNRNDFLPLHIFHITGEPCVGKSTLITEAIRLMGEMGVYGIRWDIKEDFYIPRGIIRDGKMDWVEWRKNKDQITSSLDNFLHQGDPVVFIESSGGNKRINRFLKQEKYKTITTVIMLDSIIPEEALVRLGKSGRSDNPKAVWEQYRVLSQRFQKCPRTGWNKALEVILDQVAEVEKEVADMEERPTFIQCDKDHQVPIGLWMATREEGDDFCPYCAQEQDIKEMGESDPFPEITAEVNNQ